ncbi:unnamed protein product [Gongylonema pulchrum]|uniref:Uncharacterized protein n=1 Tax=Gongylonema pulchrum TaxID=637853 RepID=A0A183EQ64_9BILA|nr:unnamed protein product [Gongylonema pulchrum]
MEVKQLLKENGVQLDEGIAITDQVTPLNALPNDAGSLSDKNNANQEPTSNAKRRAPSPFRKYGCKRKCLGKCHESRSVPNLRYQDGNSCAEDSGAMDDKQQKSECHQYGHLDAANEDRETGTSRVEKAVKIDRRRLAEAVRMVSWFNAYTFQLL